MHLLAFVVGLAAVSTVMADMINTLVAMRTNNGRWWLSAVLYRRTWRILRWLSNHLPNEGVKEAILGFFAPVSVLMLLAAWVTQQIIGFGLIWWGLDAVGGVGSGQQASLGDSMYYSGVVYFTLGFGELVPTETLPRVGALLEAFCGVLMTAMVIGYLPLLYGAYSEREQKLMMLDDGLEQRITPTNLLLSRSRTAEVDDLLQFFAGWEDWVSNVIETHTTFPMLALFRSKHVGQNWVTALGLVTDAALQCQLIHGARDRAPYWMLRRSIILFDELTANVDLSSYRERLDELYAVDQEADCVTNAIFTELYETLEGHGFDVVPYEQGWHEMQELRRRFDAQMEYLIDYLLAPRGFWGHTIGLPSNRSKRPAQ